MTDTSDPERQALVAADPALSADGAALDAHGHDPHGHDPHAYDWYPVLRRPRADGWTPARQRAFVETLADTASPRQAADAVGLTLSSAYKLRRSAGAEGFAAAWDAAVQHGAKRLVDLALERAVDGVEEPVFDRDGKVIAHRRRYNDRMLMFLIRAHLPDRYRHAHEDGRRPAEALAPALPPVADAVARLEPVRPPEPHALVDSDELEARLTVAGLSDGERPRWHDPRVRREPVVRDPRETEVDRLLDEVRAQNNPGWAAKMALLTAEAEAEAAEAADEDRRRRDRRRRRL